MVAEPPRRGPVLDSDQRAVRSYFSRGIAVSALPRALTTQLEAIKAKGVELGKLLLPYKHIQLPPNKSGPSDAVVAGLRMVDSELMPKTFLQFGATDNTLLESSSAIDAMFFCFAMARVVPDMLLETVGETPQAQRGEKQQLAERFVKYFAETVLPIIDKITVDEPQFNDVPELYSQALAAHIKFAAEFADLYAVIKDRLGFSRGVFLDEYGGAFTAMLWRGDYL